MALYVSQQRRGEERRGGIMLLVILFVLPLLCRVVVENSPLQPLDLCLLCLGRGGGVGVGLRYAKRYESQSEKNTTRIHTRIRAQIPRNRCRARPRSQWDNKPFSPKPWAVPSSFHPFSYASPSSLATSSIDASH